MRIRTVITFLLSLAALVANAQGWDAHAFGDENEIAPERQLGTPPGIRRNGVVASGGNGFLVTWEDRRAGSAIYAARFDAAGRNLDPLGIPVSAAPTLSDVRMGWLGSAWLIAMFKIPPPLLWIDGSVLPAKISCATDVAADGNGGITYDWYYRRAFVVDANGNAVAELANTTFPHDTLGLAANGNRFAILGVDNSKVLLNLFDARGTPLFPTPVTLDLAPAAGFELAALRIARHGDGFALFWIETSAGSLRVLYRDIDAGGAWVGEATLIHSGTAEEPSASSLRVTPFGRDVHVSFFADSKWLGKQLSCEGAPTDCRKPILLPMAVRSWESVNSRFRRAWKQSHSRCRAI